MRALLLAFVLIGCGDEAATNNDEDQPEPPGEQQRSDLSRNLAPDVPDSDRRSLVQGNTAFAIDLYHQLAPAADNVFYSPHSISVALAMTYAGADGVTATQMAQALHFDLPEADLYPAFNWLDLALSSRGQGAQGSDGKPFRLRVANALFTQADFPLLPQFLDTLAVQFGASVSIVDFAARAEEARTEINNWVDEATESRIPELVEEDMLDTATRVVLTNAVYFNAAWKVRFDEKETLTGTFRAPSGDQNVQMMHMIYDFAHYDGDTFDAIALPYDGEELEMLIILPDDLAAFEAGLAPADLDRAIEGLEEKTVTLSMPRFEYRFKKSLVENMKALGMVDAFGPADFSRMSHRGLHITEIVHEAFVKVNEGGTEAAAATAVILGESAGSSATMTIDRPFVFFIRDRATGAIVFVGRVQQI